MMDKYDLNTKERIVIGIDPGTNILGYGIIKQMNFQLINLSYGIVKLKNYSDHALKLKRIFEKIIFLIDEYKPDELAIEAPFYGINVQSMLKLGRAQGVAMAAALARNIPVSEYAPKKVKNSITGNGNASKEQVAEMVKIHLKLEETISYLDASDALSVAICHCLQKNTKSNKNATWKEFLKENPDKLI